MPSQNPTEDKLLNLVLEVDIDGNGTIGKYRSPVMNACDEVEADGV